MDRHPQPEPHIPWWQDAHFLGTKLTSAVIVRVLLVLLVIFVGMGTVGIIYTIDLGVKYSNAQKQGRIDRLATETALKKQADANSVAIQSLVCVTVSQFKPGDAPVIDFLAKQYKCPEKP